MQGPQSSRPPRSTSRNFFPVSSFPKKKESYDPFSNLAEKGIVPARVASAIRASLAILRLGTAGPQSGPASNRTCSVVEPGFEPTSLMPKRKRAEGPLSNLAEREGFEPSIGL